MSIEFQIGKQVVCIKDSWEFKIYPQQLPTHFPIKGQILTIRDIEISTWSGNVLFLFEEITNPKCPEPNSNKEYSFVSDAFRPIKQTSIEIFTKILNNIPKKVQENV